MKNYVIMVNDSLCHHGIKGQRWGKRNGPPYPLDDKDHSAAEKRAEKKSKKHLTDGQKKAIKIGLAITATILATYGGYKIYKNGYFSDKILGKAGINIFSKTKLRGYSENIKKVYAESLIKAKMMNPTNSKTNCGPCSILMHVNDRLNTNYQAADKAVSSYDDLNKFFKSLYKPVWINYKGSLCDTIKEEYSDMIDDMLSYGNGASGICSGRWKNRNYGHYLSWKVVDNTVIFSDGQNGRVYLKDAYNKVFKRMRLCSLAFQRLDNHDIIEENLKEIIF